MPETEIQEVKIRLYNNPELLAGELYKLIVRQPLEVRKNLLAMIEKFPLTKELERNYISDQGSD